MKKIICVLLIVAFSASTLVACETKNFVAETIESSQGENVASASSQESSEPEESEEISLVGGAESLEEATDIPQHPEAVTLEEVPKMSEENQQLYDKYLNSGFYNVLGANFSKDDFSDFNGIYLIMCFENFYEGENAYLEEYPADIFETTIQRHFNISAEDIKKYGDYNAETDSYPGFEGGGGAGQYYVITDSQQDGNLITIYYTHYWGMAEDEIYASDDSVVVIELGENDEYKYISNTTVAQYPR